VVSGIDMAEVRTWAREGGAIARRHFNNVAARRKRDRTWVTQADVEIEQFLRERISAHHPDHGITGEEGEPFAADREFVWSLDPLDGTDAFVDGLPVWGVSIGLLRHGAPYLGVVALPMADEDYWTDGQGSAYRNDTPISVSDAATFDRNDWILVTSRAHTDYTIRFPGKTRSLGSLAAHCCYVARGSAIGAVLGYPHLWDIAAGFAILSAAGGIAVTLDGDLPPIPRLFKQSKAARPLLITTPALRDALLPLVEKRGR
jgi:fructose-1,6-bisphosphatase/inositol monophosphatase family enzyme